MARALESDRCQCCCCDFGHGFLGGAGFLQLLFHLELLLRFQRVWLDLSVKFLVNFVLLIEEFDTEIIMMAVFSYSLLDLFIEADEDHHACCLPGPFLPRREVFDGAQSLSKKFELISSGIPVLIGKLSYECIESSLLLEVLLGLAVRLILGWDHSDLFLKEQLELLAMVAVVLRADALKEAALAIWTLLDVEGCFVDHAGNNYSGTYSK